MTDSVFQAAGSVAGAEDPVSGVEGPFRPHQLCLHEAVSRSDSPGWGARGQVCPWGGVSALHSPFTCPGPIIQSSVEMHFPPLGLGQYSGPAWVTQQSQRDTKCFPGPLMHTGGHAGNFRGGDRAVYTLTLLLFPDWWLLTTLRSHNQRCPSHFNTGVHLRVGVGTPIWTW